MDGRELVWGKCKIVKAGRGPGAGEGASEKRGVAADRGGSVGMSVRLVGDDEEQVQAIFGMDMGTTKVIGRRSRDRRT